MTPAFAGYSLDGPTTREEMAARAKAARARMCAVRPAARVADPAGDAAFSARRLREAEDALPEMMRAAAGGGPYAPADVVFAVRMATGDGPRAFLPAAAYWLLGLTTLSPEAVSLRLGLSGAGAAARAMRLYADAAGLPAIDLGDGT